MSKLSSKFVPEPLLNSKVDLIVRANSFVQTFSPTQGELIIGDKGVEFRAFNTQGFIQIPFENIVNVSVQLLFGKLIRNFVFETKEKGQVTKSFQFLPSKGKMFLYVLVQHISKDKIKDHNGLKFKFTKNK